MHNLNSQGMVLPEEPDPGFRIGHVSSKERCLLGPSGECGPGERTWLELADRAPKGVTKLTASTR